MNGSVRSLPRLALGFFLVLHGLAHSPGVLGSWKLATFEEVSYRPNILLEDASEWVVALLGVVWLIAGAAFIIAGLGLLLRAVWWPRVATLAVVASLVVTTLWREDAVVGLVIDVGVLVLLVGLFGRSRLTSVRVHRHGGDLPSAA
jgi:hypothetical protein